MTDSLQEQIKKLEESMATLDGQRELLGEAIDPALESMREKLVALEKQLAEEALPSPGEERRVITIIFSDVVGSTTLAEKLDPEEWRQHISRLHEDSGEIITRHSGQVAQYLGDGLLAFFGAQVTSERDPENAVLAALEIQGNLDKLFSPLPNSEDKIKLRVGIHTGLVVIGELGAEVHKEFTATGDAMNLAARLQSAAPPGGVLISLDTYRYVRGIFDFTPQPPLQVKGKSQPLQTYLVRRIRPQPFRTVTRGVAGIQTRTVGRQVEMELIQGAFQEVSSTGAVTWVQLIGEPGIGKSRLVEDTREWLDLQSYPLHLLKARAYQGDHKQPFALVRRLWFDRFHITEDTPLEMAEAKWVQGFQELTGTKDKEQAHALGLLVGLPFLNSPHIEGLRGDPIQTKGRAFMVSRELLGSMRDQMRVEILLEDLHNADLSSQEYLTEVILGSGRAANGVFVLASARPEWDPPVLLSNLWNDEHTSEISLTGGFEKRWGKQPSAFFAAPSEDVTAVKIALAPLSDEAIRELTHELLHGVADFPPDILNLFVERAEGVPYYAEEMINWLLDQGIIDRKHEPWRFLPARMQGIPLPTTLQHLLLTRLSTLSDEERSCIQCGSVFGRNFWKGGLEALGSPSKPEVLDGLKAGGFIEQPSEPSLEGQQEWRFRQTLMRETTYHSILKRERIRMHNIAGDWLEKQARKAGRLDEFAGLLGEHAERAGDFNLAADWYLQAGKHARSKGGLSEAHRYFDRSLDLLPPVDRDRRWLALLGREEFQFEAEARQADIDALIELAQESDDQDRLAQAMHRKANHKLWTGDIAVTVLEETLEIARSAGNQEIEILTLADLAQAYTNMNNLITAGEMADLALASAEQFDDEEILALVILPLCIYYGNLLGEAEKYFLLANQLVAISRRQGNRGREALGMNLLGSSYNRLGQYREAREAFQEANRLSEMVGRRLTGAHAIKDLGYIHWRLGDIRTAKRMMEEAKAEFTIYGDIETSGQCSFYLALLAESIEDYSGAARYYEGVRGASIEVGKVSLEYEALAGLARCALGQGKLDQACQEIEEVWNYLMGSGSIGMYFPILAYQTCADIFDALGDADKSRAAIEAGYTELMEGAKLIKNPQWRQSFLRDVPEHREIVAIWERVNQ